MENILLVLKRRRRRSQQPRRQAEKRLKQGLVGMLAVLLPVFFALILLTAFWAAGISRNLPSVDLLPVLLAENDGQFATPTRFYDQSGRTLLYTLHNPQIQKRWLMPELRPDVQKVFTAVFDPDFETHGGADWAALTERLPHTLAERLVDEFLLADEEAGQVRSVRMRLLAAQASARFGRDQIFSWYINHAWFNHLAFGVDAAAQLYLQKSALQLDLPEIILLAAIARSPALNPMDAPEACMQAYQSLVDELTSSGVLSADEAVQAKLRDFEFNQTSSVEQPDAFMQLAINQLGQAMGMLRLQRGGWVVITTLDAALQQQVDCTLRIGLERLENGHASDAAGCTMAQPLVLLPDALVAAPQPLAGSVLVLDPRNGDVLAYAETSASVANTANNLAAHPGGSLLTPFIYLSALQHGFSPASLLWDVPSNLPEALAGYQQADAAYSGAMRLRFALANDHLTPAARLLHDLGVTQTLHEAGAFGLTIQDGSALPFEGGSLTLLQAAQAYAVFANNGVAAGLPSNESDHAAVAIKLVMGLDGRVVFDRQKNQSQAILSESLAYLMNHMLSDESIRWHSLGYPNALEIGRPAAGKLGTTSAGKDAWAVGYTPQRVVAAWLGSVGEAMQPLDAGDVAALYHAVMTYAIKDEPIEGWKMPVGISTVNVCDPSGMLPTADCPQVVSELFLTGNEPTGYDTFYQKIPVNKETLRLATVFTPPELIEAQLFMQFPEAAQAWARAAGYPLAPTQYDTVQAVKPSDAANLVAPQMFDVIRGQVQINGSAGGDKFAYYRLQVGQGINPASWIQIGVDTSTPVEVDKLVIWDTTAAGDGLYAIRLQVVDQDQQVQTAILQVSVDNTPPTVKLLYPLQGGSYQMQETRRMVFQAQAEDALGVARVEWWLDGGLIATQYAAPFSLGWDVSAGGHTLFIRVIDRAGNSAESDPVTFTVE